MAKDATVEEKRQYLGDHVRYERWMLGETFKAVHATPKGASWNMAFEAFCIHARNLYDFLRHEGSRTNNFRADDFDPQHSKAKHDDDFRDLDRFIFHMTVDRLEREKITIGKVQVLGEWVDREWSVWANSLKSPFAEFVDPQPVCRSLTLLTGLSKETACSHPTSLTFDSSVHAAPTHELKR